MASIQRSISALFLIAITASPIRAIDNLTELDISGLYATTHPKESWGDVLVQFRPSSSVLSYEGADYPAYDVSLWKRKEDTVRKLRDGLFGTYTLAAVIPDRQGRALLWYSPDERRFKYNRIVSVGFDRSISIGSQDLADSEGSEQNVLRYVEQSLLPNANPPEAPKLEGIYDYYHSSTGRVLVGFRKTSDRIGVEKYSVTVLSQIAGVGYAVVRQGLYGGSFANDSYPLVELQTINGEHWLVWSNPAKPKQLRKNRIVCYYENGDIGIGLDEGEAKYIENTVFKRISGFEVEIGRYSDFVRLEGLYAISLNGSASELIAEILPTNLVSDTGDGKIPIFKIRSASHDGLWPGDPFYHLGLRSEEGRCILVWYSFALQIEEQHLLFDLDSCGNFKLGSLRENDRENKSVVAEFRKIAPLPGSSAQMAHLPDVKSDVDALIRKIEAVSSLLIARDNKCAWSQLELETMLEVLDLPEEMRFQQRIIARKVDSTFVLGVSNENLVETSLRKREMRIKNFSAGEVFTDDPSYYHRAYFKRALLLNLALLFYDTLPRNRKDEWRAFALWSNGLFSPDRPKNINPDGFAGDSGRLSAGLDFATFACEFFMPPAYKDPLSYVKCRLPDRYAFFTSLFESAPDPLKDLSCSQGFRDWINPEDVEHIEILVTTPTSATPASIAGHSLLLIRRKQDFPDGRDSLVLGFVAETSLDIGNGIDSWAYAYRGITGHYASLIQEESLEELVQRATILENRDVQRFRLNLTEDETARLIERLWVIKSAFTYQYKFFGQNCASMLLDTLNYVFPPEERIELNAPLVAPMHGVARLFHQSRLGEFIYPEYWSVGSKARQTSRKNEEIRTEILAVLREKANRYRTFDKKILAEIEDLFDVLFSEGSAQLRSDCLFREPILDIDNQGRDLAYERMASLWISLYEMYVQNEGIISTEEYSALAELLTRFLMNANDRELYIAIPAEIKQNYSKSDPIPADVSREYVENQLQKVQLRKRNSREMQSLRWAISVLRNFADSKFPNSGLYTVGRDLQREFSGELGAKRENIAFTHGYYPTFLSVGYRSMDAVNYAVLGFDSAVFSDELGHGSIFALKKDMKFELLSGGFDGWFELTENRPSLLSGHGTVLAVKKILTGDDVDYRGLFNHGFGITLLDSRTILWDGENLFPNDDSSTKVIEAQYILNIFERDEFRWYLNLATGAGYVFEKIDGVSAHYLGLSLALDGKFHIAGNFDNTFRCSVSYEPYLDFTNALLSHIRTSAELGLGLGRRSNMVIYLGADLDLRFLRQAGSTAMGPPDLNCYLRLKID